MSRRDDIDFGRSRAILVGTSQYTAGFEGRRPMPAALNSLREMRKVLTGPCGWPDQQVTALEDEHDSSKLLRIISTLVQGVDDVLLFYYAGHGLPLPENGRYDLGLALTDTSEDPTQRALTSLRFRHLREQIDRACRARIRIFILDCCCSGIATKYAESSSHLTEYAESATPVRGAGTYILTACGHSQETYHEGGEEGLTYFTKFLAEAVREARGEPTPGATVAYLHDEVRRRLREADIPDVPVPDLHYSGRPDQFLFVRGQATVLERQGSSFGFAPLERGDPCKVGPYVLRARLGAGGIGRVFLAFTGQGQAVAVKLLKPELGQDPEFVRRFVQEIKVMRRVDGSRVAHLVDADPAAKEPWLVSDYVCGPSLHELVREAGPLPARDVLVIGAGIAQGLADIHAVGAVHRDLKPVNVVLDETGPRVIDFGIAKLVAASLMTRSNTQLGTPRYKSPEQATGGEITGASDVFTLGSTLYFLATGQDAFQTEDPLGIIHQIAHEEPDLDLLDREVREVVRACTAKDPADRPTPAQVVEMCAAVAGPVLSGAHLRIRPASVAIAARAEALRALTSDAPRMPPGTLDSPRSSAASPVKPSRVVRVAAVMAAVIGIVVIAVIMNGHTSPDARPTDTSPSPQARPADTSPSVQAQGAAPMSPTTPTATGSTPPNNRESEKFVSLQASGHPSESPKDKIDLDTGYPGRGPQFQLLPHQGGDADLILEPERLHTYDDTPGLLLLTAPDPVPTPEFCDSRLSAAGARLTGSVPLGDLPAGSKLCVRTDRGRAVGVTIAGVGSTLTLRILTTATWPAS